MRSTTAGAGASVLVALLLLTGCGAGDDAALPGSGGETSLGDPSETPDGGGSQDDPTVRTACDEVVAGIAEFNQGDFRGTVRRFEKAVPLAKSELEDAEDGAADAAADLLEAVQYYADLAPRDYPEASLTSTEFRRYKAITLGQCLADGQAPGVPAPSSGQDGVEA